MKNKIYPSNLLAIKTIKVINSDLTELAKKAENINKNSGEHRHAKIKLRSNSAHR